MTAAKRVRRNVLLWASVLFLLVVSVEAVRLVWLLHRPVHIADHFEKKNLSSIWITQRMVQGAFSIQSEVVHSGHSAAQITLRTNDRVEQASSDGVASERDELMEAPRFWSRSEKTYDYRFSLYLPVNFPMVQQRLVLAQWVQLCEWASCQPDNPVLAIRYVNGVLFVTLKNDSGEQILYRSQGEMRGQWLNFRFVNKFSQNADGTITGWINGRKIVQFHGVTAYRTARGYPAHGLFYFKMGLYRDRMPQPMTIYIDDFSKDQCSTPTCN